MLTYVPNANIVSVEENGEKVRRLITVGEVCGSDNNTDVL